MKYPLTSSFVVLLIKATLVIGLFLCWPWIKWAYLFLLAVGVLALIHDLHTQDKEKNKT